MQERELIAVLVAKLGGYVVVTRQEMDAAREFTLTHQQNSFTQEHALLLTE